MFSFLSFKNFLLEDLKREIREGRGEKRDGRKKRGWEKGEGVREGKRGWEKEKGGGRRWIRDLSTTPPILSEDAKKNSKT